MSLAAEGVFTCNVVDVLCGVSIIGERERCKGRNPCVARGRSSKSPRTLPYHCPILPVHPITQVAINPLMRVACDLCLGIRNALGSPALEVERSVRALPNHPPL